MPTSSPDRYRRPFLIQLTSAESERLDRLGAQHGSKRQALLDGLAALDSAELEALRARVSDLEQARDRVAAEAGAASERAAAAATARKASRGALTTATQQLREARAAATATQAELRTTQQDLARTQRQLAAAQAEARRLAAQVPHHAFCSACGKLVPEAEWAQQVDPKGGVHVYHRPHGFRPKATLTQTPSVLFWLAEPRETDG